MQPPSSPSSSLSVNQLQEQIHTLNRDRLKLLKKIEKQQQKIDDFEQEQEQILPKVAQNLEPISTEIDRVDQQIHELFEDIFRTRGLSRKKTQKVLFIYESIQKMGWISNRLRTEESIDEPMQDDRENIPWQNVKHQDLSQVRQKFLQLASVFHPDKVSHHQDRDYYTEVMKEVNQAYQAGDLAQLIQIEAQYHHREIRAIDQDDNLDLNQQVNRLKQENQILKRQYQALKEDWKVQRHTPEAKVVKTYHSLREKGINPIAHMKQKSNSRLEKLEDIRYFVKRFRDRKISTQEFLNERNPSKEIAKFVKGLFSSSSFFSKN
ncbi:MAG: hypothetical protein J7545_02545 [Roseofilum sp. SBFL]|uniref:hypothetical protein n=1 Tax=unclassified Roseofilum TaxID=2620099 RepID=UPI001B0077E4|nr:MULTISPECIES: hypothetical protein [unclassified Roseofilum]MBP0013250.1 hypothetical protein [Roseofilum sp. SID3]MBP0026404.1 hypothetical protein [Roseofilum sp. SID2]MBP0038235.1 hypothetical protein [Roseofilum sp. SID1]MBP0040844.1 hypothetical protein [Roseofilum sp. SBFL]